MCNKNFVPESLTVSMMIFRPDFFFFAHGLVGDSISISLPTKSVHPFPTNAITFVTRLRVFMALKTGLSLRESQTQRIHFNFVFSTFPNCEITPENINEFLKTEGVTVDRKSGQLRDQILKRI
jgi:hypothetical protein